jgi:type IV secretory pathway VirB2 component (pilin)
MWKLSAIPLIKSDSLPKTNDNTLKTILTDLFVILGAIALLMIVIAGLRYVFAGGNADGTAQAKRMIIYSIIGLVIAALAASIVQVVLNKAGG